MVEERTGKEKGREVQGETRMGNLVTRCSAQSHSCSMSGHFRGEWGRGEEGVENSNVLITQQFCACWPWMREGDVSVRGLVMGLSGGSG